MHKYRSKFERRNGDLLVEKGVEFEYENYSLPFVPALRYYIPDFRLENGIFVETKGYFISSDRSKLLQIKQQYPDLDLRIVFQTPYKLISKKSKTRYCDWADQHNIPWAVNHIPESWMKESPKGELTYDEYHKRNGKRSKIPKA